MRDIILDNPKTSSKKLNPDNDQERFIVLRSESLDERIEREGRGLTLDIKEKILRKQDAHIIEGAWGTLGYADDSPVQWTGRLLFSNEGNSSFEEEDFKSRQLNPEFEEDPIVEHILKEEISYLKHMYPGIQGTNEIREKFISFQEVEEGSIPFPEIFTLDQIPKLRLDLFLSPDEGALVFYQLVGEKDPQQNEEDENVRRLNSIEFIQPQPTPRNNTNQRDRLTYFFNAIPQKSIELAGEVADVLEQESPKLYYRLSNEVNEHKFILKALIFKRKFKDQVAVNRPSPPTSLGVIKLIENEIAKQAKGLFAKDHVVQIFQRGEFVPAKIGDIDPSLKTLLLIHGTFASTKGSFGDVYSWLRNHLFGGEEYQQIIAYDHPTVFYGARENILKLLDELINLGVDTFEKDLDIIATSQGGLLAQYLANHPSTFSIGKVVLVASANGVGYLSFAQGLTRGLKLIRKIARGVGLPQAAFISALLQHSFDWVRKLPGLAIMTPGSKELHDIIYKEPHSASTRYLPLAGNYQARGPLKKLLELGIDRILGEENDWVVNTKNQFKAPSTYVAIEGYNPGKYRAKGYARQFVISNSKTAKHGLLITNNQIKSKIKDFLLEETIKRIDLTRPESSDYFDAHCHLFGRDVISGRLVLMLFGSLLDYFRKNNSDLLLIPAETREVTKGKHGISEIAKQIFKYFLFNKTGHQMLHDLEEDYHISEHQTYRYIPLMFDLEMTFRSEYDVNNGLVVIAEKMRDFKVEHDQFLDRLTELIEEGKEKNPSNKVLKFLHSTLKGLNLVEENISGQKSYEKQLEDLRQLKVAYGADFFPFLATDPRRRNMGGLIEENLIKQKVFHGIKLYTPNGYSPTDPHFFDHSDVPSLNVPKPNFVEGQGLYKWCEANAIPIMAHNSDSGFATFADKLQVYGDVYTKKSHSGALELVYKDKEFIEFSSNIFNRTFKQAVRERGLALNHPRLWRKVLKKYPKLKICLAHFGGGNDEWEKEIRDLILEFEHVYTDLSCQTDGDRLKRIRKEYFAINTPENKKIQSRIMYGSDYFLNLIEGISFKAYYKNFSKAFTKEELQHMSVDVPKEFLLG